MCRSCPVVATLGRVGNIARYLVAFLIPAAVVVIYRALLHRQHRCLLALEHPEERQG